MHGEEKLEVNRGLVYIAMFIIVLEILEGPYDSYEWGHRQSILLVEVQKK